MWLEIPLSIIAAIVAMVFVLFAALYIDGRRRHLLSRTTAVDFIDGSDGSRLIALLPGVLFNGKFGFNPILHVIKLFGDVAVVSYGGKRFDSTLYAKEIAGALENRLNERSYEKICLIGFSMGGLTALDVAAELKTTIPMELTCYDTPFSSSVLKPPNKHLAKVTRLLPIGAIINFLFGWIFKLMVQPPKRENVEPQLKRTDADFKRLASEAKRSLRKWPLSINRDMLGYIHEYTVGIKAFDRFQRINYVRCESSKNDVVEQPDAWEEFWSFHSMDTSKVRVYDVDTAHAAIAESPHATCKVLVRGLLEE